MHKYKVECYTSCRMLNGKTRKNKPKIFTLNTIDLKFPNYTIYGKNFLHHFYQKKMSILCKNCESWNIGLKIKKKSSQTGSTYTNFHKQNFNLCEYCTI